MQRNPSKYGNGNVDVRASSGKYSAAYDDKGNACRVVVEFHREECSQSYSHCDRSTDIVAQPNGVYRE